MPVADIFFAVSLMCSANTLSGPHCVGLQTYADDQELMTVGECRTLGNRKAEAFSEKHPGVKLMGLTCVRLPDLLETY